MGTGLPNVYMYIYVHTLNPHALGAYIAGKPLVPTLTLQLCIKYINSLQLHVNVSNCD